MIRSLLWHLFFSVSITVRNFDKHIDRGYKSKSPHIVPVMYLLTADPLATCLSSVYMPIQPLYPRPEFCQFDINRERERNGGESSYACTCYLPLIGIPSPNEVFSIELRRVFRILQGRCHQTSRVGMKPHTSLVDKRGMNNFGLFLVV